MHRAPNVYFDDDVAINLEAEVSRSRRIKCSFCGLKGAALGCFEKSCRRSFHVTCAKCTSQCRWDMVCFKNQIAPDIVSHCYRLSNSIYLLYFYRIILLCYVLFMLLWSCLVKVQKPKTKAINAHLNGKTLPRISSGLSEKIVTYYFTQIKFSILFCSFCQRR